MTVRRRDFSAACRHISWEESIMRRLIAALSTLILIGLVVQAWAGPAEEVAQISGARLQAFEEGTPDTYSADFADNAVLTSSFSAFRIEGKAAIRSYIAELFQQYPKRRLFARHPAMRVYNDDLVVQDAYFALNMTNQKGDVAIFQLRSSVTWAKLGGRWQIVDQHVSRLPMTP
jgi:uncharacterized protein (TIGR02246 family)